MNKLVKLGLALLIGMSTVFNLNAQDQKDYEQKLETSLAGLQVANSYNDMQQHSNSIERMSIQLKAMIAQNLWNTNGFWVVYNARSV